MSVYYGVIKNRVAVLPEGVQLADGVKVEIRVPSSGHRRRLKESAEDRFKRELAEAGLLCEAKAAYLAEPVGDRTPVQVAGKPLSEMIVEERR